MRNQWFSFFVGLAAVAAPVTAGAADPAGPRAAAAPTTSRVLASIDFEERRLGNTEELPMHWTKVQGPGFPHYVNARLSNDLARNGKYSFRFDLNGGSLAYRYDAGQIVVQPRAHYRVETYVRTSVMPNARAQLRAWFVDADAHPINGSMRESELYAAQSPDDAWRLLSIELSAHDKAASMIVELSVLQPAKYQPDTLGKQTIYPQDIRGTAWFDDLTVAQVPKVKMSTDRPGNIFRKGEPPSLTVLVNDRSTDDLAAQLLIRDAEGKTVYQRSGALDMSSAETLGPGRKRMRLELPGTLPAGWYEAGLVMTSRGQFVGKQALDLVLLADNLPAGRPDDRFGLVATDLPFEGWAELPDILPILSAGRVKLAVWSRAGDVQQLDADGFDRLLIRLQEIGVTPTACLLDLPPGISSKIHNGSWPELLDAPVEIWQPQLAYLVSRHANHLDRWQLGADGTEAFVTHKEMRQVYARIYGEFAKLVQKPDLAMPWPAWYDLDGELPATVALAVPPSVLPNQLPLYMQDIKAKQGHHLSLSLQLLDRNQYGRQTQMRDLAQRVIYALAADAKRIDVPLPFKVMRDGDDLTKQPQELLMVTRTLMTTLGGAAFRGKVPIAEGVEAYLFDRGGQGVLALWDVGAQGGARQLSINLGERPVAVDLFGNRTPLLRTRDDRAAGRVQLSVDSMPMFILDVDCQIAQMRASVAFDRPLIESSFMPHTRKLRFTNPWRQAISGSLKLTAPKGWTLVPPTFSFSLNPGETFERDVQIEFPYNSFAGAKTIDAAFNVQADRVLNINVPITLNLGLTDVGMQTMAIRDGQDILVQQVITNYGDKPIDYTAFAIYPGQARQERLVTNLAPGRTTIKLYRFPKAAVAVNSRVRTGVKELTGTRILNDEVEVQ